MKRTLLALMLVLSLTSLAGCGNNNTVTDKDTANNNPTTSDYQADEDGSVTSNGKTDTTDKTTTTTKDNGKTDTKGVGDDVHHQGRDEISVPATVGQTQCFTASVLLCLHDNSDA